LEKFDIKLETEFIGRNFIYFEKIDSTNKFLLNEKNIDDFGAVVLAEEQTAGHGRMGRTWISRPERNLTFSVLLNRELEKFKLSHLNLTAALSVGMALENLYQLSINLKWPNDVLIGKKKIAGILIETTIQGEKIERAVVGIGVNVNQEFFHGEFEIEPTSVRKEIGSEVSRERLLAEILNIFEENIFMLEKYPSKILEMWKARCKMLGAKVKVDDGKNVKVGKFIDIDDEGFLILLRGEKEEKIAFGDVTLREHNE
jgi:BirA family biotin operon repressor/biotin-[acetyl-CoA-carboxylase] ligase